MEKDFRRLRLPGFLRTEKEFQEGKEKDNDEDFLYDKETEKEKEILCESPRLYVVGQQESVRQVEQCEKGESKEIVIGKPGECYAEHKRDKTPV